MKTISEGLVLVEVEGSSACFVLNRPQKKNAMTNEMLWTFHDSLQQAIADDRVRTILVRGEGPCFSSGRDLKEFTGEAMLQDSSVDRCTEPFLRTLTLLLDSPKPTVAAVHGFALGGGQALSLACDFVVAERSAQFGNVEMAYGFPAAMNLVLLSKHLGRRLALEIAMTGEIYTAERYYELGLINRLVEDGGLDEATRDFSSVLNAREPWAVRRTKEAFRAAEEATLSAGLHIGDQLNQLLQLGGQSQRFHSGSADVRGELKKDLGED